jgi:uncharacterized protein (TIGR03089 family)
MTSSPEGLFAAVLAAEPSRPLVTFYDDATGERVELSARSLANWVAKTHFLLTDALGLGVGNTAAVRLPAHWLAVPVLFGCWSAGLALTDDVGAADVAFVDEDSALDAAGVPDVFAISRASAVRGFGSTPPERCEDFVLAVRPQPDAWASVQPPAGPQDAAIGTTSRAEVVKWAAERAAELGLTPGARVLAARPWTGPASWVDALLAPLSVTGSVVLVANADPDRLAAKAEQERATVTL